MTTQEKYADRIAKLLRKAESTTPEEAEALFAKAQELMAKYAIDEAMLRAAGNLSQKDDPLTEEEFVTVGIYRHALYMIDFYVLSVNGCEVVEFTGSPWRTIDGRTFKQTRVLKAVGYKSDLDRARVLLTSLKLQCMRAETSWWKENEYLYKSMSNGDQHKARRGFMFSFGKGANKKMQDAVAAARKTAETENTSGTRARWCAMSSRSGIRTCGQAAAGSARVTHTLASMATQLASVRTPAPVAQPWVASARRSTGDLTQSAPIRVPWG